MTLEIGVTWVRRAGKGVVRSVDTGAAAGGMGARGERDRRDSRGQAGMTWCPLRIIVLFEQQWGRSLRDVSLGAGNRIRLVLVRSPCWLQHGEWIKGRDLGALENQEDFGSPSRRWWIQRSGQVVALFRNSCPDL